MKNGLTAKAFIGLCIGLIGMAIVMAIDYGIKGEYEDMYNSLIWILWIGSTLGMSMLLRIQDTTIEAKDKAKDDYIKSLETYKTLADEHAVSLKEMYQAQKTYITGLEEQIEDYKEITADYQKLVEKYKNSKSSRF
jgi:hypothetical protein